MILLPPRVTRTDSLFPYTTLFRSPANKLVGADVTNTSNDRVVSVNELLLHKSGQVQGLVVSVGGFLGVGDRKVILPWDDLTISRNGDQVVAVASATKDQLKAMPEYQPPKRSATTQPMDSQIGGASGRRRVGWSVEQQVVAVTIKKKR